MGETKATRDFFLWCMSSVYLFAFSSLYHQIPGLYGDNGILPVKFLLNPAKKSMEQSMLERPTILWFGPMLGLQPQAMMELVALLGIGISFLCMLSYRVRDLMAFLLLWICYFSLYQVGQTFMWFQWDILLLEVGFLSILAAPMNVFLRGSAGSYHPHDGLSMWLVRWLLFRFMFASGVVKLTSLCPTWWGLTALNYHFESQCIPTPLAWYAHHLPSWILRLGVAATFIIEIPIPFLFFSPIRSLRLFSFYMQMLFQLLIILTGNFNFFNFLTMVLCISLLDDKFLCGEDYIPSSPKGDKKQIPLLFYMKSVLAVLTYSTLTYWSVNLFAIQVQPNFSLSSNIAFSSQQFHTMLEKVVELSIWVGIVSLGAAIVNSLWMSLTKENGVFRKLKCCVGSLLFAGIALWMFGISLVPHTVVDKDVHGRLWPMLSKWHDNVNTYQFVNSYGLFRRMTGVGGRPEVIVEGSNSMADGWLEYEFLYKPGSLDRAPPMIAPHQPRLDWQMWFAALGTYNVNPWFINFAYRLLCNQSEVLDLLEHNPFPKSPPKYIRATSYVYQYTPSGSFSKSNPNWWTRKKAGEYLPIITKDHSSVVEYLKNVNLFEVSTKKMVLQENEHLKDGLLQIRSYVSTLSAPTFIWSLFFTAVAIRFLSRRRHP